MEMISSIKERAEQLIEKGYQTDIGGYISKGYRIFEKEVGLFVGYTALFFVINLFAAFIPFASLLISGPLTAGFFLVAHKINKGESYEFSTFFKGFDFFVPLLLFTLIGGIFIALGFLALILPGIYLAVAYTFAIPFIVFAQMEFWDGMETSRKLITKKWWNIFGLSILIFLINVLGTLVLFVGLLFTIPITYCAIYVAFDDILHPDE
jgi:uncharacterized membrane protein